MKTRLNLPKCKEVIPSCYYQFYKVFVTEMIKVFALAIHWSLLGVFIHYLKIFITLWMYQFSRKFLARGLDGS